MPKRRSRRRRIVGLVLAAWALLVLVLVAAAGYELLGGRRAVLRAQDAADPAGLAEGRPLGDLREARAKFRRAHRLLANPVVFPVRILPVLGRQVHSVEKLAGAAATVSDVGVAAVSDAQRVLDLPHSGGPERVAFVRRLNALAAGTQSRLADIDLGPRLGLVSPLADAHNEIAERLHDLRTGLARAVAGTEAAATLLQGPRRYLVVAANNAEMRAGSGMFLSFGLLTTENGALRLEPMRSQGEFRVPPGAVTLDDPDLAGRWGWADPQVEWRNLMLSPRFDAWAPVAVRMWEAAGQPRVDGVVVVDPVALQAVVKATGGVVVGGSRLSADRVLRDLLHDQYLGFSPDRFPTEEEQAARREQIGGVARAAFDALNEGGWDTALLAEGISGAARGRHLLLWSSIPLEQRGWQAAGVDGSLRPDSILVGALNRGGSKLDPFIDIDAELDVVPSNDGSDWTLRVTLRNTVGADEPPYVAGPYTGSTKPAGTYTPLLAVNLPGAARGGRIDGVEQMNVVGPDGPARVVGFQFDLPRGATRVVTVRFSLPTESGTVVVEPSARVPAIDWRYEDQEWSDTGAKTIRYHRS